MWHILKSIETLLCLKHPKNNWIWNSKLSFHLAHRPRIFLLDDCFLWKANLARTPKTTRRKITTKNTHRRIEEAKSAHLQAKNHGQPFQELCETPETTRITTKKTLNKLKNCNNKNSQTTPIHPGHCQTQTRNIQKRARTKQEKWRWIPCATRPPPGSRRPPFLFLPSDTVWKTSLLRNHPPFPCLQFHPERIFLLLCFYFFSIYKNQSVFSYTFLISSIKSVLKDFQVHIFTFFLKSQ